MVKYNHLILSFLIKISFLKQRTILFDHSLLLGVAIDSFFGFQELIPFLADLLKRIASPFVKSDLVLRNILTVLRDQSMVSGLFVPQKLSICQHVLQFEGEPGSFSVWEAKLSMPFGVVPSPYRLAHEPPISQSFARFPWHTVAKKCLIEYHVTNKHVFSAITQHLHPENMQIKILNLSRTILPVLVA